MPPLRNTPYAAFNFLVEFDGRENEVLAGFSEISGLNTEITVAEYREGSAGKTRVHKLPGIRKSGNITLKRGVIGSPDFFGWLEKCRAGNSKDAKRTLVIKLLGEDRKAPVVRWKLTGAVPAKWTGPTLSAKGGGDVAMEELVLSVEGLTQE
jgi:phage tail-like protein